MENWGPWSYGNWIYNYLCNLCLSSLTLWVRIPLRARCTTLCDKVCQWLTTGWWFSPGTTVSSTKKTDCHDITKILLKLALNTITLTLTIECTSYLRYGDMCTRIAWKQKEITIHIHIPFRSTRVLPPGLVGFVLLDLIFPCNIL